MRPESRDEPTGQLAVHRGGLPGSRDEADRASHAACGTAQPRLVLGACAAGSAGLVARNLFEFPWQVLYHAETVGPVALTVSLGAAALVRPGRVKALVLGGWGLLSVVGGLSVLPLPFLPFRPEQSVPHYGVHVVYAAAQIPLLRMGRRAVITRGSVLGAARAWVQGARPGRREDGRR